MNKRYEHLMSPFTIGKTQIKNRLTVAPMGDGYLSILGPRGEYSWQGMEHCIERARGGFGMMVNGCILYADNKVEKIDPVSALLDNKDIFIKQGLKVNERCSYYDMKLFQQVTMGLGRNWGMMSCSPNPFFDDPSQTTEVLTKDQIRQKIDCVVEASSVMKAAGFAGVEVHALHWGYLLDNFAMAITNHREDEYGGCLENRLRVCKEIVEGIKQECGSDYPVMMRLGLKSYMKDFNRPSLDGSEEAGRTLAEGLEIAPMLEAYGYDALNVDAGTYDSFYYGCPPIYMPQGHCIPLAAECKKAVSIPVICGSRMNDPDMCEEGIAEGKFDAVAIGRPSLADPCYANKVRTGHTEQIRPCIGCLVGCMGKSRSGEIMTCAVNPTAYLEEPYGIKPAAERKKVAVIGAGIAGLEAARTAKLRGFDVTVFEKTSAAGGTLSLASSMYRKGELQGLVRWYLNELNRLNVPIHYNTEANIDLITAQHFDIVVSAAGSHAALPVIPGMEKANCMTVPEYLRGEKKPGKKAVVIGGGMTGCEAALDLSEKGIDVTIVESAPDILVNSPMVPIMVDQMLRDLLEAGKITILKSTIVTGLSTDRVFLETNGSKSAIDCDTVIFAVGQVSNINPIEDAVISAGIEYFSVGDEHAVGNVYSSIHSAYEIARNL